MSKKTKFSGIAAYWLTYGGWSSVLSSPYFWRSFFPFLVLFPLWLFPLEGPFIWTDLALSIIPSFLAFSLAALAILLSMPSGEFFKILAEEDKGGPSFYLNVASSFTHFIIVQIWTLFTVLLALSFPYPGTSGLGFFSFCYSIACAIAAISTLMDYAGLRNEAAELEVDDKG